MSIVSEKKTAESIGTGRRKTSVARVRMRAGSGRFVVNGRPFDEYFAIGKDRTTALEPLAATGKLEAVDLTITCSGGGTTGQGAACKLGVARALLQFDPSVEEVLRKGSMMTRDSRMKERKKYGLRGARRGTQFSKR